MTIIIHFADAERSIDLLCTAAFAVAAAQRSYYIHLRRPLTQRYFIIRQQAGRRVRDI